MDKVEKEYERLLRQDRELDKVEKEYERLLRQAREPDEAMELAAGLREYRAMFKPHPSYADERSRRSGRLRDVH